MDDLINETGKLAKKVIFFAKRRQRQEIYNNPGPVPIFDDHNPHALEQLHLANIGALDYLETNYFTNDNMDSKIPNVGPQFRIK